jgi:hypothetical protein
VLLSAEAPQGGSKHVDQHKCKCAATIWRYSRVRLLKHFSGQHANAGQRRERSRSPRRAQDRGHSGGRRRGTTDAAPPSETQLRAPATLQLEARTPRSLFLDSACEWCDAGDQRQPWPRLCLRTMRRRRPTPAAGPASPAGSHATRTRQVASQTLRASKLRNIVH